MRHRIWTRPFIALAALGALTLWQMRAASDEPEKTPRKGESTAHMQSRLDLARRGFEQSMGSYRKTQRSGQDISPWVKADQVYHWSLRWVRLDSTLNSKKDARVSAYEAHLKRMRQLEQVARTLRDAELVTVSEALAAEYYRLEAEGWLADEKAK